MTILSDFAQAEIAFATNKTRACLWIVRGKDVRDQHSYPNQEIFIIVSTVSMLIIDQCTEPQSVRQKRKST